MAEFGLDRPIQKKELLIISQMFSDSLYENFKYSTEKNWPKPRKEIDAIPNCKQRDKQQKEVKNFKHSPQVPKEPFLILPICRGLHLLKFPKQP